MPLRGRVWSFYEFPVLQCCNVNVWLPSWMISILNPADGSNFLANCLIQICCQITLSTVCHPSVAALSLSGIFESMCVDLQYNILKSAT